MRESPAVTSRKDRLAPPFRDTLNVIDCASQKLSAGAAVQISFCSTVERAVNLHEMLHRLIQTLMRLNAVACRHGKLAFS